MQPKIRKLIRVVAGSGKLTQEATEKLTANLRPADYVFVTQYFVKGGAEKVMLNYVTALRELDSGLKIAIVTTDVGPGPSWTDKIPRDVQLVDGSAVVGDLRNVERRKILDAVVRQLKPRVIHIVNSGSGYLWVRDHANDLKKLGVKVFASLFNSDYTRAGKLRSYYHKFLPAAAATGMISKVFTDNEAVIEEATEYTGLPRRLFKVHYQPVEFKVKEPKELPEDRKLHILWASRVAWQKRPDILREIAEQLDPNEFMITVRGELDPEYDEKYFAGLPALKYRGKFSSIAELQTSRYDVFMYTSQADGVPNILLEMLAEGMLIVAPDEGGVSEIINERTGILVEPYDNVDGYVAALGWIHGARPDLKRRVAAGQKLLMTRHSKATFSEQVEKDIYEKI